MSDSAPSSPFRDRETRRPGTTAEAERYRLIFNRSTDAILVVALPELRLDDVNERAAEILGYAHDALLGQTLHRILPRQVGRFRRFAARVAREGRGWANEFECRTASGHRLPVEMSAWPLDLGGQPGLLIFARDITRKVRTERMLWESEQKFSTLIRNMREGVMIVDNDDVIEFVNERMTEMLGYAEGELVGAVGYRKLFSPGDQRIIRDKNRLRTRGVADQYEIEMMTRGGMPLWVHISGVPITGSDGRVVGSFGIITDISERKRSEAALKQAKDELERRVADRTRELEASNAILRREIAERRQVEAERQKFISLVENSNDFIAMMEPLSGRLIYLNEAGRELIGLEAGAEVSTITLAECHPAAERAFIAGTVLPAIRERGEWQGELPLVNLESGRHLPTLFNGFAVRHPVRDTVEAVAVICRDITDRKRNEEALSKAKAELESRVADRTAELSEANQILMKQIVERKRAEEQLQQSEYKYRLLFNSGNDSILVFPFGAKAARATITEVNDVACRKLGYAREDLLRMTPGALSALHGDALPDGFAERLASERHILYEDLLLTRTGDAVPVEISAHLFEFAGQPSVMAIARDITARRRAEEQLRDQAALLDKAQDAILVCDLDDYIIYWNKSAERLYGWRDEEAIGTQVSDLLFPNVSTQYDAARRAVLKKREWQGELYQQARDGREVVVESRWTLVHDNAGDPKSILLVNTDVTDKRRLEVQFLRSQRMESIGALAGGVAHDLNNILSPILTAVQVLQVRFDDEKSQKILATMESNVRRGADMIKQILTFARGAEGERVPLQVGTLIQDLDNMLRETFPRSVVLDIVVDQPLPAVRGDLTQLHQVLLNLCVNARDALDEGGHLTIHAASTPVDDAFARTQLDARPGQYVRIRVADDGIGIPDAILDKVFEPFFTTKEQGKGTGLGLSTVVTIVKSHGGFVCIDSEEGRGTTVDVYLPASVEELDVAAVEVATGLRSGNGELILLADDERSILDITREALEGHGYRVIIARDGSEALDLYTRYRGEVAAVITDMMMPVMDGSATIRALRHLDPDLPIIASSGYLQDARVREIVGDGVRVFLHKPYTAEQVLDVLHDLLGDGNGA